MRPALAAAKAPENLWELCAQDFIAKTNCAAGKNGSAHSILFGTRPVLPSPALPPPGVGGPLPHMQAHFLLAFPVNV